MAARSRGWLRLLAARRAVHRERQRRMTGQYGADGSGRTTGTSLRGRSAECAVLDQMLSAVRAGESRVLVLRGDAGLGKTALLDYVVGSAGDMRKLRAAGVESDMELPFAALHQLCVPLLDRVSD